MSKGKVEAAQAAKFERQWLELPRSGSRPPKQQSKDKVFQMRHDGAASTGNSPIVRVIEHMRVYGNENSITPFRRYWEATLERYGIETEGRKGGGSAKKAPRKAKVAVLNAEEVV